jgi:hypothetical protein
MAGIVRSSLPILCSYGPYSNTMKLVPLNPYFADEEVKTQYFNNLFKAA